MTDKRNDRYVEDKFMPFDLRDDEATNAGSNHCIGSNLLAEMKGTAK